MGRIHFVGGEKGGVGKSFTARLLSQYLIDRGISIIGFDSDSSHSTFSRFYGDFCSELDVHTESSLDQIVSACVDNTNRDVVVDLAAQTFRPLGKWLDEGDILTLLHEFTSEVYLWHVMDDGMDSQHMLLRSLEQYAQQSVRIIVVQNLGRGEDFGAFEQSEIHSQAQLAGARFITLPKLQDAIVRKMDANSFSFWAVANNPSLMSVIERKRAQVWLDKSYQMLDNVLLENNARDFIG